MNNACILCLACVPAASPVLRAEVAPCQVFLHAEPPERDWVGACQAGEGLPGAGVSEQHLQV